MVAAAVEVQASEAWSIPRTQRPASRYLDSPADALGQGRHDTECSPWIHGRCRPVAYGTRQSVRAATRNDDRPRRAIGRHSCVAGPAADQRPEALRRLRESRGSLGMSVAGSSSVPGAAGQAGLLPADDVVGIGRVALKTSSSARRASMSAIAPRSFSRAARRCSDMVGGVGHRAAAAARLVRAVWTRATFAQPTPQPVVHSGVASP